MFGISGNNLSITSLQTAIYILPGFWLLFHFNEFEFIHFSVRFFNKSVIKVNLFLLVNFNFFFF